MIWLDTYIIDKVTQEPVLSRILMGNGAGGGDSSNVGFIYANADFNKGSIQGQAENDNLKENEYYIYK